VATHTNDGESSISGEQKKIGILHPNKQTNKKLRKKQRTKDVAKKVVG
jgi:hypothetical protein